MKFKLFLTLTLLIGMFSCSVDQNMDSQTETKELVQKTMQELYVISKSTAYTNFVNELKAKTSSASYTPEEAQQIVDDFIAQQSPEFIAIFNRLVAMNLTEEQLLLLAEELKPLVVPVDETAVEDEAGKFPVCDIESNIFGNTLGALIKVIFCDTESDDTNNDETETSTGDETID